MKHRLMLLGVLLLCSTITMMADDKKKEEKEVTIKGEVVDVACYIAHGAKGEGHKACGESCAKAGGSLGILTSDGKLYLSLLPDDHKSGPNDALMEHVSHTVEAKGFVRSKGGVNGLMITSVAMAK